MSEASVGGSGEVVDLLDGAVAGALGMSLGSLSAVALTALLGEYEVLAGRFDAVRRHLVAEIDRRGVAGEYAAASTADLLAQRLLLSRTEASARVRQARELAPRVALSGEVLAPLFVHVGAAVDAGEVSLAHARIITRLRSDLPAEVDAACGDAAEQFLVAQARELNPTQLGHVAQRLQATLDPDGTLTDQKDHERKRHAGLSDLPGGGSKPAGYYTPELTAILKPIFESLSAPQPLGDEPDPRSPGQRVHDGLIEFGSRILRSDALPDAGGVPVSVLITVTDTDLAAAQRGEEVLVTDAYGTPLPLSTVLNLGGEIELTAIRLSCTGGITSFGHSRRLATIGQRRALAARDKGCAFPGCTRSHAWAEVHHIIEWLNGGSTDLDNLVLLCRFHHRHFEQAGWKVRMAGNGVPEWIPPAWIDEHQKPRRNTAHDQIPIPLLH